MSGTGTGAGLRIGPGFDLHPFLADGEDAGDRVLTLGGVAFPGETPLRGHSDADAVAHACADALLGAAGLGDIGEHFPDSDPRWRGAASSQFVTQVVTMLGNAGWCVGNADITVLAEAPRVARHRTAMCEGIASLLGVSVDRVNVKATTTEKPGFIGRGEGLAAQATVLIVPR